MCAKYSEKLFKKNFVKWFKDLYPLGHIQLIESEATSAGVPDINICKDGKEIWVELKSGYLSKNSIKPGQYIWHIKRQQANGVTWIVHRDDSGLIKVYNGKRIREFREQPNKVPPDKIFNTSLVQERAALFAYLFS